MSEDIQRQLNYLPAPSLSVGVDLAAHEEGDQIILPVVAQIDPQRYAHCLQQAQRYLPENPSMLDAAQFVQQVVQLAREFGGLAEEVDRFARAVGPSRPVEQVIQSLCAAHLRQQMIEKRGGNR